MRTLLLALPLILTAAAHAQPRHRPAHVLHLTITGNLETMQAARDLKAALLEADRDRCALVVLQLGGDESRLDVVHEMARSLHTCTTPVVAYLQDADQAVGAGALALGLIADDCILGPQVTISGRAAGIAQSDLAPEETNLSAALDDLAQWMQPQAKARELPQSLDSALLSPSRPLWAVVNSSTIAAAWERPPDGEVIPIVVEKDGQHTVSLPAKDAVRLHYAAATLETWPLILNRRDLKNAPRVERTISAGLTPKALRAESLLTAIDQHHDAAKAALKLPWPAAKDLSAAEYHKAAASALAALTQASAALTDLEKLLETYPEVMRRPAPGQTAVAGKPSTYATRWRTMVQQRRDRIRKLEDTAKKFEKA